MKTCLLLASTVSTCISASCTDSIAHAREMLSQYDAASLLDAKMDLLNEAYAALSPKCREIDGGRAVLKDILLHEVELSSQPTLNLDSRVLQAAKKTADLLNKEVQEIEDETDKMRLYVDGLAQQALREDIVNKFERDFELFTERRNQILKTFESLKTIVSRSAESKDDKDKLDDLIKANTVKLLNSLDIRGHLNVVLRLGDLKQVLNVQGEVVNSMQNPAGSGRSDILNRTGNLIKDIDEKLQQMSQYLSTFQSSVSKADLKNWNIQLFKDSLAKFAQVCDDKKIALNFYEVAINTHPRL